MYVVNVQMRSHTHRHKRLRSTKWCDISRLCEDVTYFGYKTKVFNGSSACQVEKIVHYFVFDP